MRIPIFMYKKNELNMHLKFLPTVSENKLNFITNSMSSSLEFMQSADISSKWIADAKEFIRNPRSIALSAGRENAWNDGWSLCLEEALMSSSVECFLPHYIRNASQSFLVNCVPSIFESNSPELLMADLSADNILHMANTVSAECIVEIGCGTGWRLELLRRRGWRGKLLGGDFAHSSKECIDTINKITNANIEFIEFDMLKTQEIALPNKTLLYTYGALEQIGGEWANFLKFCKDNKSHLNACMHFEPFSPLYDLSNCYDKYSLAIHNAKNYLDGYLEELIRSYCLAEIDLTVCRLPLGSKLIETANYAGWRFC